MSANGSADETGERFAIAMGWREDRPQRYAKDLFGREVGSYGGGSIRWDESKHPRDADGKFTDGAGGGGGGLKPGAKARAIFGVNIPYRLKRKSHLQNTAVQWRKKGHNYWVDQSGQMQNAKTDAEIEEIRKDPDAWDIGLDYTVPEYVDKTIQMRDPETLQVHEYTFKDGWWSSESSGKSVNQLYMDTAIGESGGAYARIKPDPPKRKHKSYESFRKAFYRDAMAFTEKVNKYRKEWRDSLDAGKISPEAAKQSEQEVFDRFRSEFVKPKRPQKFICNIEGPTGNDPLSGYDWRNDESRREKVADQLGKARRFYYSFCESRDLDGVKNVPVEPTDDGRASCMTKRGKISLDDKDSRGGAVAVHELAHLFEREENTAKVANEFLMERVKEKQGVVKKLKDITGNGTYKDYEVAYVQPDGRPIFQETVGGAYISKVYDHRASNWHGYTTTEVTTMGIEKFYRSPIEFAIADPEYFGLIVSILRGEI